MWSLPASLKRRRHPYFEHPQQQGSLRQLASGMETALSLFTGVMAPSLQSLSLSLSLSLFLYKYIYIYTYIYILSLLAVRPLFPSPFLPSDLLFLLPPLMHAMHVYIYIYIMTMCILYMCIYIYIYRSSLYRWARNRRSSLGQRMIIVGFAMLSSRGLPGFPSALATSILITRLVDKCVRHACFRGAWDPDIPELGPSSRRKCLVMFFAHLHAVFRLLRPAGASCNSKLTPTSSHFRLACGEVANQRNGTSNIYSARPRPSVYIYIYIYIYTCIYAYLSLSIYIYICIYIYTHTHI